MVRSQSASSANRGREKETPLRTANLTSSLRSVQAPFVRFITYLLWLFLCVFEKCTRTSVCVCHNCGVSYLKLCGITRLWQKAFLVFPALVCCLCGPDFFLSGSVWVFMLI